MTGRDFSYAYFVSPLRYRTPDKQCGPGRYRGLTAFASLSMAVSVCNPQAIRTIECRRSNRSEELRNGRRISDGRAWFEGDLETAVQQAGWLVTPENRHICPACRKPSRT